MPAPDALTTEGTGDALIRVVVVDNDVYALHALSAYLEQAPQIEVLRAFESATDALNFLRGRHVDVVLTDVRMPGMDGLELLSRIKQESPDVTVVVLTGFDDDTAMLTALTQHANGFLYKTDDPSEVVRAVLAAYKGGTPISPDAASRLVADHLRPVRQGHAADGVTPAEQNVLDLLCEGMSNAEIADMLTVAESTVKRHVSSLMHKYGVNSRLRLVIEATKAQQS
ncbi:MAG: response regulator transcription factor [Actinomyces succiniciruminis]|uniref:Two-component system response regulator n=1 Tax=Actinomyces succiniciruminis TaxID=1522002 RepID=A0A1L7RKQ7_9ACTO|nr:response regulator transcription factor [Actinomyces succiniciruminis]MBE6475666.1 response regulator transcription factor [Actinomyces succiniciruminis]MBM6980133.1 response regulator transcription factor [Actinomyces succiniciruminis]CED90102.1 Two-component system response regulator [Actinomyces succiniciruminis]